MCKQWLWISIMGLLLTACESTTPLNNTLPPLIHTGPVTAIDGVEPRYEPYDIGTMKDYKIKGKNYHIVTNPETFSQIGLATWYGQELHGNKTALGEVFNANELTAAHPTLPLPSYVRVTNLSNNRQLVVRVNDRGPFTPGRIIDLSKAAANRLNVTNQTKVRLDVIIVAPDGTLSGPGTIGTEVAKKTYALPDRPNIGSPSAASTSQAVPISANSFASDQQTESANISTQPNNNEPTPTLAAEAGSLTLSAPQQGSNVNIPAKPATVITVAALTSADNVTAVKSTSGYVLQVGALNDRQQAEEIQKKFSNEYKVPGMVSISGAFYRIQLGPFSTKQQAQSLQQRLLAQGQPNTFIMSTPL